MNSNADVFFGPKYMFRVARVDFTVKTCNVRPSNKYKYGPGNDKNENKTENG